MQNGFGLVVRFTLKEGAQAAFDRLVSETIQQIRSEPGTLVYACHEVNDHPQQRIFYELYKDESAFQDHEAQAHTKRFLAEREQYLTDTQVDFLALTESKGVQ